MTEKEIKEIDTKKYIICCPLCDNRKCVRGSDRCEAEQWARRKKEEDESEEE